MSTPAQLDQLQAASRRMSVAAESIALIVSTRMERGEPIEQHPYLEGAVQRYRDAHAEYQSLANSAFRDA